MVSLFEEPVSERASRALSMPVALREAPFDDEGSSSWPRSSVPRVFFSAFFALPALALVGREASSSFSSASFSAFLRAASAALAAAASLIHLFSSALFRII
jgi:hypothetical protein